MTYNIQDLPHIVRQLLSPDCSKSLDKCCTVSLGWSSQTIQTPVQIRDFAPEGEQGACCECYLLKWDIPCNLCLDFSEC